MKTKPLPLLGVRVFPFAGDGKWYWQDEFCEEPMGPFDTYKAAWADYKAVRKSPSAPSTSLEK